MPSKYKLIIYRNEQNSSFIEEEVPEAAEYIADAQTYQETVMNVKVMIQEWMEKAIKLGKPFSKSKGRLIYA